MSKKIETKWTYELAKKKEEDANDTKNETE
jgi:hypothetical protein